MWAVFPFCNKDYGLLEDLLHWIHHLDNQLNHGALLVCDPSVQWHSATRLLELAQRTFQRVEIHSTDLETNGWPQGANLLFREACRYMSQKGHWFWCEPDCVPVKKGWLTLLENEYFRAGKPFLGSIQKWEKNGPDYRYMAGCAVYPKNCWEQLKPHWSDTVAFDVATASGSVPRAAHTSLINHFWGQQDLPPTFAMEKTAGCSINTFTLNNLNGAAVFHRNKDGTLISLLRANLCGDLSESFAHGGDVGDLIYGMAAMKALGPRLLVLHKHPVREAWSPSKVKAITPLLKLQPYICDVIYAEEMPQTKFNFNPFRQINWNLRGTLQFESLCSTQLKLFGLPLSAQNEPWLVVDNPTIIDSKPVVIHRSPRYHNPLFPWKAIHRKYGRYAIFVGMPSEHADWQHKFGPIDYIPTEDYLQLARIIAGSKLFIGNQSCPYAIAEGLKVNAILEAFMHSADCQFVRNNLINTVDGQKIILPDL